MGPLSLTVVEGALKRKYGGVPGYLIAAGAALAGALILPRLHLLTGSANVAYSDTQGGYTGTGSTGRSSDATGQPGGGSGAGIAPGGTNIVLPPPAGSYAGPSSSGRTLTGTGTTTTTTTKAPAPAPKAPTAPAPVPNPISGFTAYTPGASAPPTGNTSGGSYIGSSGAGFVGGAAQDQPAVQMGGAPSRPSGSRSADAWEDHHPALRRPTSYPQFVRSSGDVRTHVAEVIRIATRAGIHPARLIALNPYPTGLIRIA